LGRLYGSYPMAGFVISAVGPTGSVLRNKEDSTKVDIL
jgi:hypothetical protein